MRRNKYFLDIKIEKNAILTQHGRNGVFLSVELVVRSGGVSFGKLEFDFGGFVDDDVDFGGCVDRLPCHRADVCVEEVQVAVAAV